VISKISTVKELSKYSESYLEFHKDICKLSSIKFNNVLKSSEKIKRSIKKRILNKDFLVKEIKDSILKIKEEIIENKIDENLYLCFIEIHDKNTFDWIDEILQLIDKKKITCEIWEEKLLELLKKTFIDLNKTLPRYIASKLENIINREY